ncbi:MAG: IS5 family transposase [Candidatus Nitrosotenuis sp.]
MKSVVVTKEEELGIDSHFHIRDKLWKSIEVLIPKEKRKKKMGRKRMDDRKALNAIFYVLRTGCQWKALPRSPGAPSTVHDRFQQWRDAGLFERLWKEGLLEYDARKGIDWEWQSMDCSITKAPLGGKSTGPNPTDRAKSGTKRSLLVEGRGIPIGLAVDGANRHDINAEKTLENIAIRRPDPDRIDQNICLDKGYDFPEVDELVEDWGYTAHIARKGVDQSKRKRIPRYRARRWVVERTHSWMNRFRRLLIRWEKEENYVAMLHLACAWITYHASGLFGYALS